MGLVSIFWVAYAQPYSPVDVMPAQPNGVVMPTVGNGAQYPANNGLPNGSNGQLQNDTNGQPVQPSPAPQQ